MRQAVAAIARNCLRKIVAYFASASGQLSGRTEWHALKSRLYFNAGKSGEVRPPQFAASSFTLRVS